MTGWAAEAVTVVRSLFTRRDVVGLSVAFTVGGAVLGALLLPAEWSAVARAALGAATGFNGVLYVVGPRMVGGADFN